MSSKSSPVREIIKPRRKSQSFRETQQEPFGGELPFQGAQGTRNTHNEYKTTNTEYMRNEKLWDKQCSHWAVTREGEEQKRWIICSLVSSNEPFPFSPEGGSEGAVEKKIFFPPVFRRNFFFLKSKTKNHCNWELLTFRNTDFWVLLWNAIIRNMSEWRKTVSTDFYTTGVKGSNKVGLRG